MTVYKYPGYETGQGWTLEPGNLEEELWGDMKEYWGLRAQYSVIGPPESAQDSPVLGPFLQLVLQSSNWLK